MYEIFPVGQLLCCSYIFFTASIYFTSVFCSSFAKGHASIKTFSSFSLEKLIVASGADGSDGDCQL